MECATKDISDVSLRPNFTQRISVILPILQCLCGFPACCWMSVCMQCMFTWKNQHGEDKAWYLAFWKVCHFIWTFKYLGTIFTPTEPGQSWDRCLVFLWLETFIATKMYIYLALIYIILMQVADLLCIFGHVYPLLDPAVSMLYIV